MFYDKNNALFIYLMAKHHHDMKQLPELLTSTFLAGHKTYGYYKMCVLTYNMYYINDTATEILSQHISV